MICKDMGPVRREHHTPTEVTGVIAITGSRHPVLAQYAELAHHAGRQRRGQAVVEGPLLVRRALADRLPVDNLLFAPSLLRDPDGPVLLEMAQQRAVSCYQAGEGLIARVTTTRPTPNVLAVLTVRARPAEQHPIRPDTVLLVAEAINNPDNLGMLLRTADAAGASAVLCAGEQTDPFHKHCVRAARGAVGRVSLLTADDLPACLRHLRARGVTVVGAALHGEAELFRCALPRPVAIVVGNEQSGLHPETLEACSLRLRIPMMPGQDSLNVGVAAGILLYEVYRQAHTVSAGSGPERRDRSDCTHYQE
ncbi:MAG: RNA methyltransferase [Chloroherpetonaceae bacterium]|nr:RNA methyltransferase [Chthonomonadaceae bacterium]MDW8207179.1 RNA methyltransferase [Chloroherpetonaceae bacterium]